MVPTKIVRLLPNLILFLLLVVFSLLVVWTTAFHKWTYIRPAQIRLTNNGQQFRQNTLAQSPTEPAVSPASTTTLFKHDDFKSGIEANNTLFKHDDFKNGIQANDTVLKYTFRSNRKLKDYKYTFRPSRLLKDNHLIRNSDYFRPRPHVVNPLVTRYMIEPRDLCRDPPVLLIMIPSLARNTEMRKTIRGTWGSVVNGTWPGISNVAPVKLVFVFGRSDMKGELFVLATESRAHRDVLYADFEDTYRNLSYKSLTSLHWAATRCPRAPFLVKVDEDTFVNVPFLLAFLRYHGPDLKRTVLGFVVPRQITLHRDPKSRWVVDRDAYPLPVWPRYLAGHSYVITGDVVEDLARASQYIPFIPVEDSLVTGVLARVVNATRLHNPLFAHHIHIAEYTHSQYTHECDIVRNVRISISLVSKCRHKAIWGAVRKRHC